MAPLSVKTDSTSSLYPVDPLHQICNPSVSHDTNYFRGCLLFLNLEGAMSVNVPDKWKSAFPLEAQSAHDRLTVVDTSNTVRWFLMKPAFLAEDALQDPRWSTHPDYAAFLGDADNASSGYVVRLSTKEILRFNAGKIQANSTPYLWVPDHYKPSGGIDDNATPSDKSQNATWDAVTGMIDKQSVRDFFGTDSVKISFSINGGGTCLSIYCVDYADSAPAPVLLPRPSGRDGLDCESAHFSPDGKWVVYNCRNGNLSSEAYLQRCSPGSQPVLLHQGNAAEPHWWQDRSSGETFVLYCTTVGLLTFQFENAKQDGSLGETLMRQVDLGASTQWQLFRGQEFRLAGLPFQGGLSPDGRYLVTGYQYGYILSMPSAN